MRDYIALMLANLAAGLMLGGLALFNFSPMAWGLLVTGAVGLIAGLHMCFTGPLGADMDWAHTGIGELSALFGVTAVTAGLGGAMGAGMVLAAAVPAFVTGLAAIVVGGRLWRCGLTLNPALSGVLYIVSGAGGVLVAPGAALMRLGHAVDVGQMVLGAAGVILFLAGIGWLVLALGAYRAHVRPSDSNETD